MGFGTCTSDILQQMTITGSLDSFVNQNTFSSSSCDGTNCGNVVFNVAGISDSTITKLDQTVKQNNGRGLSLNCAGGPGCLNSALNNAHISNSKNSAISTETFQANQCTGSNCFNGASDNSRISDSKNSAINTHMHQYNGCSDSSCNNNADDETNVDDEDNKNVNDRINQQNLCIGSKCNNTAKDPDNADYKNTQMNICTNTSQCDNTGVDVGNICVDGAKCENGGSNSKIISVGEPCHNAGTGRVICALGYILTRP